MSVPVELSFSCSHCGERLLVHEGAEFVTCPNCGTYAPLAGHLCPECGTHHGTAGALCDRCGAPLAQRCPSCDSVNWSAAKVCQSCGVALDAVANLVIRRSRSTADRLHLQMQAARELKQVEAEASARRMAELETIESERRKIVQQQEALQQARERRMFMVVLVIAALAILTLLVYLLLAQAG